MTSDETLRERENMATAPASEGDGAAGADAAANENGAPVVDPEVLAAELADTKDKLLRALAEVENVRRRAQRDKEDATRYATAGFARDMLGVADNLRRALESIAPEARSAHGAVENLVVGVEMTERTLLAALERNGVRAMEAVGQVFDANRHEALYEVPDPNQPAGTILQVVERGYMLRDRLLRPAKVGIAKGGPKAEPVSESPPGGAIEAADQRASTAYGKRADAGGNINEEL